MGITGMGTFGRFGKQACLTLGLGSLLLLGAAAQGGLQPIIKGSAGLNGGGVTPVSASVASIRPLSVYTPFGPLGIAQVPFWKKHLPDDAGAFSFEVDFSQPVGASGGFLWYTVNGSAQDGVHYSIGGTNPLRIPAGASSVSIPVTIHNVGQFFREVNLEIELTQGVGVSVSSDRRYGQLNIRPSTPPPTLSVPAGSMSVTPMGQVQFQVQLSAPSMEPVALHYSVDSASTLTQYLFPASGTAIIPAGQTTADLRLICGPGALAGEQLILNLRHERNGVRYVIPA
ncbi:MAG: hypothetical protein KDB61_08045, partial [Planctomycetes bacterium]|nr:hypothetical protein [Planctomycetota bacterium]